MSIKLICFDLDGVLSDTREIHYIALNEALASVNPSLVISREEHLSTFDARTTKDKLRILTERGLLAEDLHQRVWELKQKKTGPAIQRHIKPDYNRIELFQTLRRAGILIAVCSNATRENVQTTLKALGLWDFVDFYFTNQDVIHPKPHGEIYQRAMLAARVNATETIVVEDSHIGRKAARNSGANLYAVNDHTSLNNDLFLKHIEWLGQTTIIRPAFQGKNMNVLIPMAGLGSRFQTAGYTFPKPLIEVEGKPMIQLVVENLNIDAHHIFIVQKEHYEKYNLKHLLNLIKPNCSIIQIDGLTEGAVCTTLVSRHLIDNSQPLLIANSDQYLEWDSNEFLHSMDTDLIHGGVLTFTATHPKWSFVKLNSDGFVCEVVEKKPISNIATCGVYYWRKGSDYVKCADKMIQQNIRTNNEFYVAPTIDVAVKQEHKLFKVFPIEKMWGIGTPEDLNVFLQRNG